MAITLHDLAQACSCNVSTVSRALRGDVRISPDVRTKITNEAARQGYRPNLTARSLVNGRSGTIWFVVGSLESPIDHLPAEAASRLCQEHGRDLLVAAHHGDQIGHQRILGRLRQGLADGAIIAVTLPDQNSAELRDLAASGFPLVFIDRHVPGIVAPVATTDHKAVCQRVVSALATKGITDVANLHPAGMNSVEDARRRALDQAMADAGLRRWLTGRTASRPIGVVASAWSHFDAWRNEYGALPPGSLLVVYDQITGDPPAGCGLIVVKQDFAGMAAAAWALLQDRLDGAPASRIHRRIPPLELHYVPKPVLIAK